MTFAFELLEEQPGFRIGRVGSLIVTGFSDGGATLAALNAIDRLQTAHRLNHPYFATLSIVSGRTLRAPPDGVRERSVELDIKFDPNLFGSAVVIETKGLAAVVARTFMAAYSMLSPRSRPFKVCSAIEEATEWLRRLPEQPDALKNEARLAAICQAARASSA